MDFTKVNKTWLTFLALEIAFIIISFFTGYWVREISTPKTQSFNILFQAFDILNSNGLKDLPPIKSLEYGMIKGMVQVYNDPHTIFVEPPQAELQSNQLHGKFGGIGARLQRDSAKNLLLYPFPDSPAYIAGVREGDQLIAVDNLEINVETPMDNIQSAIRGSVDTVVTLTIIRPPGTTQNQYTIKRQEIELPSVTSNLAANEPRVGIIQINIIAETTPTEVEKNISNLRERGATNFILDLRNDYGGLVDAGVNTARLFLDGGTVIQEQYRNKPVKTYSVDKPGALANLPIVILVNQNTASAAEIIAGSLQARHRAILIGNPTYGKDTIQLVFELDDKSSLHVTAAHWWIPDARAKTSESRLQPDLLLSESDAADNNLILQSAINKLLKQDQ